MRLENLRIELAFVIPVDCPDKNGVVYSKEAIEKAIKSFNERLPIIYRDNNTNKDSVVLGNTVDDNCSVLWDDEHRICKIVVNGNIYYGGTECIVNKIQDGIVTDFDIISIGLSK